MELKIEIDETKFKDIIEKELSAFSKEELHEIIRECIIEALHNDDTLKSLFITKESNYFGSSTKPSDIMVYAAKSIDLSPAYKEIQDKMINVLKTDYHNLLERTMLGAIKDGFLNDWDFKNRMACEITNIINAYSNNQG